MATDIQEITEPQAPPAEADKATKQEKVVFTGDYPTDSSGRVTFVISFPREALESDTFRPVEGILGLANKVGLKGYGEGDTPQATLGVGRAKLTDKTTNEKIDNPDAGKPTGTINLVLHTAETFVEAQKRGRSGMSDTQKKAVTAASGLIKMALAKPGNDEKIQAITDAVSRNEIDTATALRQIAELMA
jgi:hypothetical protein